MIIPSALPSKDSARLTAYRDNLAFYAGEQWSGSGRERRLVFNYARANIDKVTSYLMSGFNAACDPIPPRPTPAEKDRARAAEVVLRTIYDANNLRQLDFETEVDAAILGDGCYKVTWDPAAREVRVTAPDVQGLYAWHAGDDMSRIWKVASRYPLDAEEIYAAYQVKIPGPRAYVTEEWTVDRFITYLDDAPIQDAPNPYGFIPFIIFPNLRQPKQFWGASDIPPITEVQRELNRALSQLSRILELSGNPIAVLENVEASSGIQVQPGAVWNLPESSKAYLLDLLKGGGARLHIEYLDVLYRCLHDLSEAPRAAYGGIDRELSGVALEVELHSLLQKVNRKRNIRTATYRRRNEMMLELMRLYGGVDFGPLFHRIVWGTVIPQDKARQSQNEQLLVTSGVHSRRRAMDELGVEDPEQEFHLWMEERQAILEQNQATRAVIGRGGPKERATASSLEGPQAAAP
jgi:hypothetical protein